MNSNPNLETVRYYPCRSHPRSCLAVQCDKKINQGLWYRLLTRSPSYCWSLYLVISFLQVHKYVMQLLFIFEDDENSRSDGLPCNKTKLIFIYLRDLLQPFIQYPLPDLHMCSNNLNPQYFTHCSASPLPL